MRNCVVRRVDSLQTLLTGNADTDVRCLDHADVVGAVTNGERHRTDAFLDERDNQRFLQWGDTAADHALALHRELQQEVLVLLIRQRL